MINTKIDFNGRYFYVSNASLIFKNFKGEAKKFNAKGNRNFHIQLTKELADGLLSDFSDLNIKFPEDDLDESYNPHIVVKIATNNKIPEVYKIIGDKSIQLTERTLGTLDNDKFDNVDLVLRPYHWEINDKTGTSLYLQKGYFTVEEDIFSKKYSRIISDDTELQDEYEEVPF